MKQNKKVAAKVAAKPAKNPAKAKAKKVAPPCNCAKCKKANGGKCPDALPPAPDMGYVYNKGGKTCYLTVCGFDPQHLPPAVALVICDKYHGRNAGGVKDWQKFGAKMKAAWERVTLKGGNAECELSGLMDDLDDLLKGGK